MSHRSRFARLVIDCHTDHVEHAAGFWAETLGHPCEVDEEHNAGYLYMDDHALPVVVQGVVQEPRVLLDIETDDKLAEMERVMHLGAKKLGVFNGAIVMEAPTGHRFRIVDAHGSGLRESGNYWGEET